MDQLIKVVNKLQDAFAAVNVANPVDLPQIVVIGSQSSGKSSVLESLVQRDFLPRGTGIVTRCPLILMLINRPSASPAAPPKDAEELSPAPSADSALPDDEWGEFLHKPGVKFRRIEDIRAEIVSETDRKTGSSMHVSREPITLRYYSPHVLTLTLVDLPGLTKVPVGDQPKDIERQLRTMSVEFISKANSIILAVSPANADLATSDGIQLAREVDPEGVRTLGVLTKVDLMDKGTDVVRVLRNEFLPLRMGYVPVVNRGQRDIEGRKSVRAALEAEQEFFSSHPAYASNASFCGSRHLAQRLHKLLLLHIRSTLPDIKARIAQSLAKYRTEMSVLGDIAEGTKGNTLLTIITEFTADYQRFLDGQANEMSTAELSGGARIAFVFHEIFASAVAAMDPFDQTKEADIRTLLYNSSGSSPSLFVPTSAFELLVKQQIRRLEDPALKCVQMIFNELVLILGQLLQKPVFKRFPQLRERFYTTALAFFRRGMEPTLRLVSQIVAAEACYINTAHPDFVSGHRAMAMVYDKLQIGKPGPSGRDEKGSGDKASAKSAPPLPDKPAIERTYNLDEPQSVFGSFFKKASRPKPGVLEPPPSVLKASGSVSEREFTDIEAIKLLITSYYSIVKETVIDMVPKAIMLNLVHYTRDEMQKGLLGELYKEELLEDLLQESPEVVQRRRECRKMIEALQKADDIVSTV